MAGQQRLQIYELQFDKFLSPSSFLYWKIRFKTQVSSCSDFPSDAMVWIKEVEMVDSVDDKKKHGNQLRRKIISRILRCWMRRLLLLWTRSDRIPTSKKKVDLEEQEAQKEDQFLRGRQNAYMIHDYFRVIGAHDTDHACADLFSITLRNDDVQDFDTRWDEILLSVTKIPSDDVLERPVQIENTRVWSTQNCIRIVRHANSSEDISS